MLVTWPYLEFGVKRVIVETWLMRCMMLPSVNASKRHPLSTSTLRGGRYFQKPTYECLLKFAYKGSKVQYGLNIFKKPADVLHGRPLM